jgi:phage tail P2-like protein
MEGLKMPKSIYDVTLLELLPENLRNDPDIIAASKAVDQEFQVLANSIKKCLTIADIDNASTEVVDYLATEMNTEFYDQSFDISNKKSLVKNAYVYHYTKGTASAIKKLLHDAIGQGEVQEWFQYGGQPYYFKIVTDITDPATIQQLITAINSVKNERSHLDGFFASGTHESLRSYTHLKLSEFTHSRLGSGTSL